MLVCSVGIDSGRGGAAGVRAAVRVTFFAGRFFGRERLALPFALTGFFFLFAVVAFFFFFLMASPRRGRQAAPSTGRSDVAGSLGGLGNASWRPTIHNRAAGRKRRAKVEAGR
jgi:high-affinity Fe2+/Pb2+ permease